MQLSDKEIQNIINCLKNEKQLDKNTKTFSQLDSKEQKYIRELVEKIGTSTEADEEKIKKLKNLIKSENYNIPSDKIAKKIIDSMLAEKL